MEDNIQISEVFLIIIVLLFFFIFIKIVSVWSKNHKPFDSKNKDSNEEDFKQYAQDSKQDVGINAKQDYKSYEDSHANISKKDNESRKKAYYKEKGDKYEIQIGRLFQGQGYKVYFKGINEGRRDNGIDLIAYNGKEVALIQCKNWERTQVKHEHLRIFMGDCSSYLEKNLNKFKNKDVRRIFVTSCKNQDYALQRYIEENEVEYIVIPYS
ncbi:hypothetical protein LS73_007140 [Helicobacter muridarum]|uniref:Restriction endonuclease type IV Mrr domain-containing protein n=1 Tax=Helicobacter muridarum TaxID=216 RepID=A0A377PUB5_9HELI|nr:restriction endonuclease [Helicobacter muridarum]TLD99548.1 hypothetical protein LS73_007140 [Helicobacter muridarum]STQ85881.1 Uncharacterised protein [Helicobacter muridarum]